MDRKTLMVLLGAALGPAGSAASDFVVPDCDGLVAWAHDNRSRMNERGQTVFRDLELLGQDLRVRGSEGGLNGDEGIEIH